MSGRARMSATTLVTVSALAAGVQAPAAWEPPEPWAGAMAGKPVPG